MEVPQIEYQEVVRHVTVPQVVTQEVVRQVPVPQPFVQMVKHPVPQVMNSEKMSGSDGSNIPSFLSEGRPMAAVMGRRAARLSVF